MTARFSCVELCDTLNTLNMTSSIHSVVQLTAGRAKKEMANTEKQDAIVFPIHVCGTLSPYPMVVTVTFGGRRRK